MQVFKSYEYVGYQVIRRCLMMSKNVTFSKDYLSVYFVVVTKGDTSLIHIHLHTKLFLSVFPECASSFSF